MKLLHTTLLAGAVAASLAACTEAQKDDTFAILCGSVSLADSGFQIYAAGGKVSAQTIKIEADAVRAAQAACDGPRPTDVRSAVAAVQRALKAIADATATARRATAAGA